MKELNALAATSAAAGASGRATGVLEKSCAAVPSWPFEAGLHPLANGRRCNAPARENATEPRSDWGGRERGHGK